VIGDRDEHVEEVLDAPMAIAQQAEGFVEAVVRSLSDL
jgi:hypothetical protein